MANLQTVREEALTGANEIGWGLAMACMAVSSYAGVSVLLPTPWLKAVVGFSLLSCGCVALPLTRWALKKYVRRPCGDTTPAFSATGRWLIRGFSIVVATVISVGLVHLMRPEIEQMTRAQFHPSALNRSIPVEMSRPLEAILIGQGPVGAALYMMMAATTFRRQP